MSVSEHELSTIGQRVNACERLVKELEKSANRFTTAGVEGLRLARARLRAAQSELRQLKDDCQLRLMDAPLKETRGRK